MKKAVENKVFVNGTIDGYTVVAIDGTKFFGSNKKSCPECLKNIKGEKTHCFHSGAVMSTVGAGPKLVIGFEMYRPGQDSSSKDEGELNVGKNLGIDAIVRAKNNNNKSLRQVKKKVNKLNPIVTTLMGMPLKILFKIIRARWDIENSIFNNLKSECGLEHCFVHGGKAVGAVLYLIFIASNIMQMFLIRRLKKHFTTQREMVRLLVKGLYLLKYKSELIFNST